MLCDLESGLPSFLEPAWIELVVLGVVALFGWWHWRRWSGKGELARQRPGLRDYLLGVEQALAADWRPARRRLHEVVEADRRTCRPVSSWRMS